MAPEAYSRLLSPVTFQCMPSVTCWLSAGAVRNYCSLGWRDSGLVKNADFMPWIPWLSGIGYFLVLIQPPDLEFLSLDLYRLPPFLFLFFLSWPLPSLLSDMATSGCSLESSAAFLLPALLSVLLLPACPLPSLLLLCGFTSLRVTRIVCGNSRQKSQGTKQKASLKSPRLTLYIHRRRLVDFKSKPNEKPVFIARKEVGLANEERLWAPIPAQLPVLPITVPMKGWTTVLLHCTCHSLPLGHLGLSEKNWREQGCLQFTEVCLTCMLSQSGMGYLTEARAVWCLK